MVQYYTSWIKETSGDVGLIFGSFTISHRETVTQSKEERDTSPRYE